MNTPSNFKIALLSSFCGSVILLVLLIVMVTPWYAGVGQHYRPEMIEQAVRPGMDASVLNRFTSGQLSDDCTGDCMVELATSGVGALFNPQFNLTIEVKGGEIVRGFVEWVHRADDVDFRLWRDVEQTGS